MQFGLKSICICFICHDLKVVAIETVHKIGFSPKRAVCVRDCSGNPPAFRGRL